MIETKDFRNPKKWFQQQTRDSIKPKTWTEGSFRNQELTNTGLVTGINQCWVVIKNRHSSPIIWRRSDNCLSNCEFLDRSFLKTAGSLRLLKTGTGGSLIPGSKTREEVVLWIWNIQKLELTVIRQMKYPPNTIGDNLGKMLILFSWEYRKPRPYLTPRQDGGTPMNSFCCSHLKL